jgi:hypothetical protein
VPYNFQTGNNKIKLLIEYESVTQEVLFCNAVLAALMSERKYLKMETVQGKAMCVRGFFETKQVIKTQHHHRTQYGKKSTFR